MLNIYGLGAAPELQAAIDGFLSTAPNPSSSQVADFLKLYVEPQRSEVAQGLVASGVSAATISSSMQFLAASGMITKSTIYGLLSLASAAASGYHGIKRNHGSIGYGIWWFFMGGLFPIITPIVAIARKPGFAKAK
jgi:hypothetical protein